MENQTRQVECGEIISAITLPLSDGTNLTPVGINGPLVAKIPVVLAEKDIQIDVEARFRLNEPYYEIKRIRKNVYLTQCKLLPRSGRIVNGVLQSGKLFIGGYVRKNIEYATADCVEDGIVSGRIAHTTIDVPFTAVTEVQYVIPPVVNLREVQREIDLLCTTDLCHECNEMLMGKSPCEQSFEDSVIFTEKPYCELEAVRIYEEDIHRSPSMVENVEIYDEVLEKMVVYIRLKVLQLQQVNIPL